MSKKMNALHVKFAEIIGEALTKGYSRGIDVFMENLEEDLAKKQVLNEVSTVDIIDHIMTEAIEPTTTRKRR